MAGIMNPTSSPLVSIVVPVYNDAEFLAECLESILAQTYHNWDCLIVNNCSSDDSAQIAHQYVARDRRFRLHENAQHLRAVCNYNAGLRLISPDSSYCKIVFADDWIFPECLAQMVALAEENPSVGIVGAFGLRGNEVVWAGLPYPCRKVSGRKICRALLLHDFYVFGTATALLYRSDLVRNRNPFYNESNLHCDSEVCLVLLKSCDFGFVHQVLTFTRVRPGSLTSLSAEINTVIAGKLYDLMMYGKDFLSESEFRSRRAYWLRDYYHFLARQLGKGRNREFWAYHKRKLRESGVGYSRLRLALALLEQFLGALLNPLRTVRRLLNREDMQVGTGFVDFSAESDAVAVFPGGEATPGAIGLGNRSEGHT